MVGSWLFPKIKGFWFFGPVEIWVDRLEVRKGGPD
jgi:hypothetical protein